MRWGKERSNKSSPGQSALRSMSKHESPPTPMQKNRPKAGSPVEPMQTPDVQAHRSKGGQTQYRDLVLTYVSVCPRVGRRPRPLARPIVSAWASPGTLVSIHFSAWSSPATSLSTYVEARASRGPMFLSILADLRRTSADSFWAVCGPLLSVRRLGSLAWSATPQIQEHPEWYAGLSPRSTFEDFQKMLHGNRELNCPKPCSCHTARTGE